MDDSIRHTPVKADSLPKAAGPYSAAVVIDKLIFVSGQGATNPKTDRIAGSDIESQTEQVLRNVQSILQAAGSDLNRVVRCSVYLTDMSEFERMNVVYKRVFGENRPARTTVQVAALPDAGLRIEIDAIAYR